MPSQLVLWGAGTSRTIRAHWAMHELGLEYERRPIEARSGETKTAEYTRLNPRQKVPLLQDGDFVIGESAAIVAYLSQTYSTRERSLVPEQARDFAKWLEWCFFIVAELDSTSLYVMRSTGRKDWRIFTGMHPTWSPAPASISGSSFVMWRSRCRTSANI